MKVTIKKAGDGEFQVDIEPSQTVADLKKEINKAKDYPTEHQRLIHSGKNLRDDVVFETIDFNPEKDTVVLLVSKPRPAQPTTQPSSPSPLSSTPLPETVKPQGEPASTAAGPPSFQQKSPAQFPSRPTAPIRPKGEYVPAVAGPSSLKQWNPDQTTNGASHEPGTFKDKGKQVAREEPIHNDPRVRQMLLSSIAEDNPAMAKHFEENPALFDSLLERASAEAEKELGNPKATTIPKATTSPRATTIVMSSEEIDAVERLVGLGFNRNRAIEAYIVSDKNEELAVNFLLSGAESGPADMADASSFSCKDPIDLVQDPSFRQQLSDCIAQKDPSMAQEMRENPHLFEAFLQGFVLDNAPERAEDIQDIQYLVDLGFTREQATEAYLVSDKNKEHAAEYLLTVHADTQGERDDPANLQGSKPQDINKSPAHYPSQTTAKSKGNALVEEDTITVISPSVQSDLTVWDSRAIQRIMGLGFSQEQAMEAYLICDKDEAQTRNYLHTMLSSMESGPDNSVTDHLPVVTGSLAPDTSVTDHLKVVSGSSTPDKSDTDHSPAVTGSSSPSQMGSELPEITLLHSGLPPPKKEIQSQLMGLDQRSQAFVLLLGFIFLVFLHPFVGLFIVAGLAWQRINT